MNDDRKRVLVAVGVTVLLFLGVQLGALALLEPFYESERQAVDDPTNPTNSIVYFGIILVATGFMLAAFKYDLQGLIRAMIVAVSVMLAWYVLSEFVPPVVTVGSTNALAAAAAAGVGAALYLYPEWYVIDGAGVLIGAGAAALFGISFGLLPALLLLTVLAVYDAISVYGTEHMLDLAEGVMDLKIPVVLVVPTTLSYSYLAPDSKAETLEDGGSDGASDADSEAQASGDANDADEDRNIDRDALFIGLGDAVIPTILVVSAAFFLEAGTIAVPLITLNWPALGALVGTIAGLLVLMYMVLKGRAHAGLPLLNGGAIGGYLLGALASGLSIATAVGL
ncbi:presenilin family intramembrane aspartyl protease PSH [Halopiger aswanensis]|uniref:Presenilin-like A22 family membrane protease n=1 Tax=Halopiger aswanensis TaxID=148449 RepID=A0A419WNU6_9EURY|nr:presenilin family intramembrane aspartyl protease PSH [Halopiger aswanensis]RKD97066.1 presenilin-like A22 family membrane protease [Halopiger aswanensis]